MISFDNDYVDLSSCVVWKINTLTVTVVLVQQLFQRFK